MKRIETPGWEETVKLLSRGVALLEEGSNVLVEGRKLTYSTFEGRFSMSVLPGNRRVLVSHGTYVNFFSRDSGVGRKFLQVKEEIARSAGITLMLATVCNDNAPEIHLLETEGWKRFTNRKDTWCSLWAKELVY
jgi:GNAT superfamily N-acetyltransferase